MTSSNNEGPPPAQEGWDGRSMSWFDTKILLRRNFWIIIKTNAVVLFLMLIFLWAVQPNYIASALVVIEKGEAGDFQSDTLRQVTSDPVELDSQVEIIKSQRVAAAVVDNIGLDYNEFARAEIERLQRLYMYVRSFVLTGTRPFERSLQEQRYLAIEKARLSLLVSRVGNTRVLDVRYRSSNSEMAAKIANAFAKRYLFDRQEARRQAAASALSWLTQRVDGLREQTATTDLMVQRLRSSATVSTNFSGSEFDGDDIPMLVKRLVALREERVRLNSSYEGLRRAVERRDFKFDGLAEFSDLAQIGNRIVELRQIISGARSEGNLEVARANLSKLEFDIVELANKYVTDYRKKINESKRTESELNQEILSVLGSSSPAHRAVVLANLERESEMLHAVYREYLKRMQEALQKQFVVVSDARVASEAVAPLYPSFPNVGVVAVCSVLVGLLLSGVAVALKEWRSWSSNQLSMHER